jgi:glucan phosphoethanolaminetransferase (alkaline phosphatase superfamily)
MENKSKTISHKPLIVYVITALMLFTSLIYFYVTLQDYNEISQMSSVNGKDATADIMVTKNEMTFFLIVGIAYIPVAIWMSKVKHNSKIPYIISIVGSAALILFYILTRPINIGSIGLQNDIGIIDVTTKVIQVGIISISSFLIVTVVKEKQTVRNR